jgi:hypothetical protein
LGKLYTPQYGGHMNTLTTDRFELDGETVASIIDANASTDSLPA